MKAIYIKPAPGKNVFNPSTGGFLPATGARVEKTQYWSRRIAEGGAVLSVDEKQAGVLTPVNRAPEKAEPTEAISAPAPAVQEPPAPEKKKVSRKRKNKI